MTDLRASLPRAAFLLRQLGPVGWFGLVALALGLLGLALLVPQLGRANAETEARLDTLRQRLAQLQDPRTARAARDPVAALVASLPPASEVPDFVAGLQKRAEDAAVQIDRTEYRVQPALGHAAQRYRLSFPANADYPHLRTWLEALLHDYPNLILDELTLHRAVDGGEELEARVGVSFLVRDSK
jgi:hypothetical protein